MAEISSDCLVLHVWLAAGEIRASDGNEVFVFLSWVSRLLSEKVRRQGALQLSPTDPLSFPQQTKGPFGF